MEQRYQAVLAVIRDVLRSSRWRTGSMCPAGPSTGGWGGTSTRAFRGWPTGPTVDLALAAPMIGIVRPDLPTGTVTFLFTDIEGSTKLLQELGDRYDLVQKDHMRLMREAIASGEGHEIRTEGDSFFVVFPTPDGAVRAAVGAQRAFSSHQWRHGRPIRVRMGMHTGQGRLGGDDYLGIDVNRAARIAAAGHGGQVLLSEATRRAVEDGLPDGVSLRDLGGHRLKDLAHPEHVWDLMIEGLSSEFPPLKTLDAPVYLPAQLTSFVGRQRLLDELTGLLDGVRLVTLTGPGGTGKTRMALEGAARLAGNFPDGTYFVDLSAIRDPRLVPDTIASALRLRPEVGLPTLEVVTDHLRDRAVLLVLDNFEQVVEGADAVGTLLRVAAKVRGLATSRVLLGVSGEREVPVPPLEIPDREEDPEAIRQSEAVSLFAERAAFIDPTFSLTDETVPIVAEICARLDGLPLAIELAASRVRVLSPPSLLERLERRLPVLVAGPRDAPARQRTLRGAIAWSYDLLDEVVRSFFRRLSVFAGGFTVDAAATVADPGGELGDATELIEGLVQNSLVQRVADQAEPRFRMLETIREFAAEVLGQTEETEETEEAEEVRRRHADHYVAVAAEAEPHLTAADQRRWIERLTREHDNMRAALAWAIDGDHGEIALRLGAALWRFWYGRGHIEEGRRWLETALALPSARQRDTNRVRALTALGGVTYWQNDYEASDAAYEEALAICVELEDHGAKVQALFNVAMTKGVMGQPETALSLLHESLELARELGDQLGEAWALWGLGLMHMLGGDLERAEDLAEHSRQLFEELNDTWGLGNALAVLGDLASMRGAHVEARDLALRSIDLWEDQGNALVIASQIRFMANAAHSAGKPERAAKLAAAAAAHLEKVRAKLPDAFFPFRDPGEAAAELLNPETFDRLWAEGWAMSLEEAVAYAREEW
jgi:predicted ATPase/class 3 adenylate cyclase